MRRIRGGKRKRRQVAVGVLDGALTPNAGMAVVAGLRDRLRDRRAGRGGRAGEGAGPRFRGGELLLAAAQLAGEDFLTWLDRHRADAAGQQLTPVPGLTSTTAAGVARRITGAQWLAVETGLAAVTERMMGQLPARRAAALAEGPGHDRPGCHRRRGLRGEEARRGV